MAKKIQISMLLFFLSVYPLHAETPLLLSEERAVSYALENNVDVLSAAEEVEAAKARLREAASGFYPHFQASGHYSRYRDHPYIPFDDNIGYRLEVTQNIFTGGGLTGLRAAAAAGRDAAGYAKEEASGRVRYAARAAFFDAVLAEEVLRINEEALGLAEEMLGTIRARFKKGEASNYELLRQRVEAANVRSEASRSRNNVERKKNLLKGILGLDADVVISLEGELEFLPAEKDPARMKSLAALSRPRLREMKSLVESADMSVRAARSGYYPGVFMDIANISNREEAFSQEDRWLNYWEARVSVSVPIFQGGAVRARVDESKAEHRRTRLLLDQAMRDVEIEVENALLDISSSAERVGFQEENVETAREAYAIISRRYAEGQASHLDVMDARLALSEAEMYYAGSLKEHSVARAGLELAVGAPVF